MGAITFDTLIRSFSQSRSRRGIPRLLSRPGLAGFLAWYGASGTAAREGR
jgi:hypothetical protein